MEIDNAQEDTGDLELGNDRGLRSSCVDIGSAAEALQPAAETPTHLLDSGCPSISGVFMDSRPSPSSSKEKWLDAPGSKWKRVGRILGYSPRTRTPTR